MGLSSSEVIRQGIQFNTRAKILQPNSAMAKLIKLFSDRQVSRGGEIRSLESNRGRRKFF